MFTKVLVPLDRSSLAEQAIGQAAAIARACHATIDLVSVYEPFTFDEINTEPLQPIEWDAMRDYLDEIADELWTGAQVRTTYGRLQGDVVGRISRHARDFGADLIVLTSHGRTGVSRAWLGSVADGLIRYSNIPVLVLRPIENAARRAAARRLFKHVLVPTDGSARSLEVLPSAIALAKCGGARISLLRVVTPVPRIAPEIGIPYGYIPSMLGDPATKGLVEAATNDLDDIAARLRAEHDVDVDTYVVTEPSVSHAVLEFAHTHDVDLIALSTHGRGASRLLVGSVADKLLRGTTLPLLAYRPTGVKTHDEILVPDAVEQMV